MNRLEQYSDFFKSNLSQIREPYEELNSAFRTMIECMDDDPRKEEYLVMWSMINEKMQTIFDKL